MRRWSFLIVVYYYKKFQKNRWPQSQNVDDLTWNDPILRYWALNFNRMTFNKSGTIWDSASGIYLTSFRIKGNISDHFEKKIACTNMFHQLFYTRSMYKNVPSIVSYIEHAQRCFVHFFMLGAWNNEWNINIFWIKYCCYIHKVILSKMKCLFKIQRNFI